MKKNNVLMAILFVIAIALVIVCAYQYSALKQIESAQVSVTSSTTVSHAVDTSPQVTAASSSTSVEFPADITFSFKDHPGITFKVLKVSKVVDPTGEYRYSAQGIENPALLTVTLQITNNSNETLNANYLQVLYSQNVAPEEQNLLAPYYIHTSYESDPMTQTVVTPTFIVPNDRASVSLVTGVYPPIEYATAESKLSRSTDAFIIDFIQKTVSHLEG